MIPLSLGDFTVKADAGGLRLECPLCERDKYGTTYRSAVTLGDLIEDAADHMIEHAYEERKAR